MNSPTYHVKTYLMQDEKTYFAKFGTPCVKRHRIIPMKLLDFRLHIVRLVSSNLLRSNQITHIIAAPNRSIH